MNYMIEEATKERILFYFAMMLLIVAIVGIIQIYVKPDYHIQKEGIVLKIDDGPDTPRIYFMDNQTIDVHQIPSWVKPGKRVNVTIFRRGLREYEEISERPAIMG